MRKLEKHIELLKRPKTLNGTEKTELLKELTKINLLTPDFANTKTAKSKKEFSGYTSFIMHLSPADIAFKELSKIGSFCPMASKGCKMACLNTAGRGKFNSVQQARLRKSLYYIQFRKEFLQHLIKELTRLEKNATKNNKKLVIRLNGTSDIPFESIKLDGNSVIELFPNIQFYDYTAIPMRLKKVSSIPNYSLTFSAKEDNWNTVLDVLSDGKNTAVVFDAIPDIYQGFKVINGDLHDFRFKDTKGVIVGLSAKGDAKKDTSGFVHNTKKAA